MEESQHQFQEVKFCQVNFSCGAHRFHPMVPIFEKKNSFTKEIGENLLYANSQNSTQPDMHIDISFAIYIHHSVTCQYIKLY